MIPSFHRVTVQLSGVRAVPDPKVVLVSVENQGPAVNEETPDPKESAVWPETLASGVKEATPVPTVPLA